MEYYSAIKRNELRICITWMYLKGIVPSEKFQSQNLICIIIIIKMSINKKLMHIIFMYFHKQLCEEGSYLEPRGLAVLCPFCGKWLRLKQWFWGLDCLSKKKKDNSYFSPFFSPSSWQPPVSSQSLPFQEYYINGSIQYVIFFFFW